MVQFPQISPGIGFGNYTCLDVLGFLPQRGFVQQGVQAVRAKSMHTLGPSKQLAWPLNWALSTYIINIALHKKVTMTAFKIISLSILIINLFACATNKEMNFEQPNHQPGRVLYLSDEEYREGEPWQFISWKCRDYYGGGTLVEVGRPLLPEEFQNYIKQQEIDETEREEFDKALNILGFVLYDGSDIGDFTVYYRDGLSHRWDWGPDNGSYSFVIKPDGTGLFYDFSTAENGKKSKADDVFKCSR